MSSFGRGSDGRCIDACRDLCGVAGGADFVKIFPVSAVGGASYVKAIRSVFPEIDIVPTGGISIGNAESFLAAGAAAVGVGSELTNSSLILDSNLSELRELAKRFVKD